MNAGQTSASLRGLSSGHSVISHLSCIVASQSRVRVRHRLSLRGLPCPEKPIRKNKIWYILLQDGSLGISQNVGGGSWGWGSVYELSDGMTNVFVSVVSGTDADVTSNPLRPITLIGSSRSRLTDCGFAVAGRHSFVSIVDDGWLPRWILGDLSPSSERNLRPAGVADLILGRVIKFQRGPSV
jgi:hypothetical protein